MNLRDYALGQQCQIRLPGICNFDPATTVLAHYRIIGISGMGTKSPDILGAWACYECHRAVDRQGHMDLERDFVRLAHAEGMARTQAILVRDGAISW
jgi:hypothetical protein